MKTQVVMRSIKKLTAILTASSLAAGFLALPVSAQTVQATVNLTARNLSQPDALYWSKNITAFSYNRIEFQIQIKSSGIASLYNVRVSANFPSGMRYILGSTRLGGLQAKEGATDYLTDYYGLHLAGTLSPGESKIVTFQAEILDNSYFQGDSVNLFPYVSVWADNLTIPYRDSLKIININRTATAANVSPTGYDNLYPILYIEKRGANVSRGDLSYTYTTYASPNEVIEFAVKVRSASLGTLSGVWVRDRLPSELAYIAKSTFIEDKAASDGIAGDGIEIGVLAQGQTKTIKFRARVLPQNLTDGEVISLANYASARAAGTQIFTETDALIIISKDKYAKAAAAPAQDNDNSSGEVLGAATVKTGPAGIFIIVSLASLLISAAFYYIFRRDKIFQPFRSWNNWRLNYALRRLQKEKID